MRSCQVVMACVLPLIPALAAAQSVAREPSPAKAAADATIPVAVTPWLAIGGQLRGRAEAYHNGGFTPRNSPPDNPTPGLRHAPALPTRQTLPLVQPMCD